ncbi:hypothetical protein D3C86_1830030 [compost metagenome]
MSLGESEIAFRSISIFLSLGINTKNKIAKVNNNMAAAYIGEVSPSEAIPPLIAGPTTKPSPLAAPNNAIP